MNEMYGNAVTYLKDALKRDPKPDVQRQTYAQLAIAAGMLAVADELFLILQQLKLTTARNEEMEPEEKS